MRSPQFRVDILPFRILRLRGRRRLFLCCVAGPFRIYLDTRGPIAGNAAATYAEMIFATRWFSMPSCCLPLDAFYDFREFMMIADTRRRFFAPRACFLPRFISPELIIDGRPRQHAKHNATAAPREQKAFIIAANLLITLNRYLIVSIYMLLID